MCIRDRNGGGQGGGLDEIAAVVRVVGHRTSFEVPGQRAPRILATFFLYRRTLQRVDVSQDCRRNLMTRRAATITFVLAAALLVAVHVSAQSFAVEKLTLKNGMTVILYPDHSLPVAAVNVWYRVGSKDEQPRRSGFAHLFEHLMFMGTERVPNGDLDRIMEAAGGSNNASTSADRTNYFSSGPASLLPTLLWLDADRLEDLARAMDQKKLDLQRDVVLNELRQTYENQPYGRAELAIQYLLYPGAHPYHFATIGTEEDLKAAQVNDVKDFFATYYTPSNASLVVAGDFDPKEIRPLVENLFGTLPRGAEPPRRDVPPATLNGVKRGVAFDKVQLPQLSFAYHAPKGFGPGDAETDLVAAVLADGKSSRLYKRLVVDDALATSVTANNESQLLGSVFRIDVQARPDADLERVETRANFMNQYEFFWGEPNSFQRDLDRYRNATKAAVLETARRVITQNARVLFRVLPEQPRRAPGPRASRVPPAGTRTLHARERNPRAVLEHARLAAHRRRARSPDGRPADGRGRRRRGPRLDDRPDARRGRGRPGRAPVRRGRRRAGRTVLGIGEPRRAGSEDDDPLSQFRERRLPPRGRRAPAAARGEGLRACEKARAR